MLRAFAPKGARKSSGAPSDGVEERMEGGTNRGLLLLEAEASRPTTMMMMMMMAAATKCLND